MHLRVNDVEQEVEVRSGDRLLDVQRGPLGLTGTKEACGVGECEAGTVLVDGLPVMSCITLASRLRGDVTTIEGAATQSPAPSRAFAEQGGLQCGFCTPGQIVIAHALIAGSPLENNVEQRRVPSGNICRCTGYEGILRATRAAAAAGAG